MKGWVNSSQNKDEKIGVAVFVISNKFRQRDRKARGRVSWPQNEA